MAMDRFGRFGPYVPVGDRIAKGRKRAEAIAKMAGRKPAPVVIEGRNLTSTVWGTSWCQNLERYSDIANRLERGRTLVRNGSVVDLVISKGRIDALVCGSDLYEIEVVIAPATKEQWTSLVAACGGRIDSVVELLAGRLSNAVMSILTDPKHGLFPEPRRIQFSCSCPDAAQLCKHIAATLYGVGARLDAKPDLLFVLRDVDPNDLVEVAVGAGANVVVAPPASAHVLAPDLVAELFGVEWDAAPLPALPALTNPPKAAQSGRKPKPAALEKPKRARPRR